MSLAEYENFVEGGGSGVAAYALDPTNAERLWELSQATLA
jgi:hypothetical protein